MVGFLEGLFGGGGEEVYGPPPAPEQNKWSPFLGAMGVGVSQWAAGQPADAVGAYRQ